MLVLLPAICLYGRRVQFITIRMHVKKEVRRSEPLFVEVCCRWLEPHVLGVDFASCNLWLFSRSIIMISRSGLKHLRVTILWVDLADDVEDSVGISPNECQE